MDLKIVDVTVKQDMLVVIVRKHDPFVQSAVKKRRCPFIEVEGSVKPDEDGDAIVEFLKSNT